MFEFVSLLLTLVTIGAIMGIIVGTAWAMIKFFGSGPGLVTAIALCAFAYKYFDTVPSGM